MDFAKVTMVGHLKGSMKGDEEIRIYNMYNIQSGQMWVKQFHKPASNLPGGINIDHPNMAGVFSIALLT